MNSLTGELNYTSIGRTVDINTDNYYTKAETDNAIKEVETQLKDYAKISYVNEQILNIKIPDVDLSDYYTKQQVDNLIPDIDYDNYYTKEEVNGLIPDTTGFALKTEIPDVSGFALKTEIPDTTGFVSEERVLELIEEHGGGNLPASEEGEF